MNTIENCVEKLHKTNMGKIVSIKAGAEGMIAKAEGVVFLTTAYNLINISL